MAILMLKCDKNKAKAMKSLLGLYRRVLHNVNNKIYYLDELTYTTTLEISFRKGIDISAVL